MLFQQIRLLLFLFFISISTGAFPQCYLSGETECDTVSKIYLYEFRGTEVTSFDSAEIINRSFCFNKKSILPAGYYRLSMAGIHNDIILNHKDSPVITLSCNGTLESIENSPENTLLFELKKVASETRSNEKGGERFRDYADSLFRKFPDTYFTKATRPYLRSQEKLAENEYLDNIPFEFGEITRSTLLPHLYMQYFRDYVDYDEEGFRHAIDTLLLLSGKNVSVYEFTLEYLTQLFHTAGPEVVFEYLVDTYVLADGCVEGNLPGEHIERYLNQRPGMPAPEATYKTVDGSTLILRETYKNKPLTLVMFWSSGCPHCKEEHGKITALERKFGSSLGLVGFSLDTDLTECRETMEREKMTWPVICDAKGWDASYVETFVVNKTPSFILIDNAGKIVARNIRPAMLEQNISDRLGRLRIAE